MADRLTLIGELESLRKEAALRGDDRAADLLRQAGELILSDQRIDKVRRTDRERRRKPSMDSSGIQRNPVESTGCNNGFPTPLPKKEEEEKRERATGDPMYEINRGLLESRMGDHFDDARRFVEERDRAPVTWAGWYGEMLTILTGGKATPEDVAQVCRDDSALEPRPGSPRGIGSPRGLRVFVANAVEDRLSGGPRRPPAGPAGVRAPSGARTLAATDMLIGEGA